MGFCEKCHGVKDYRIEMVKKEKDIKGELINYIAKEAYCTDCGEQIFISSIRDYNLDMMDKAYREKAELITIEEIEKILKMYNIGKRPLSKLLGWGEVTLTRYLDGDIPTKQYSEKLKEILDKPEYVDGLLERNRNDISESTYKKSKEAINELFKKTLESKTKLDMITRYILKFSDDITPLALQKLLYYAQGFCIALYDEYLFNDDCEAWIHGPVYRNIYYKYMVYGRDQIEKTGEDFEFDLSQNEEELLNSIISYFGCYSGKILERMTHIERPWREARDGLHDKEISNVIIVKDSIKEYFTNIKNKYNMLNVSDIKDYSRELFGKLSC